MACLLANCCLCKSDVSSGTDVTKRKKLFGSAASQYRNVLDDLGEEFFGRKVVSQDAYICYSCCSTMNYINTYTEKADKKKTQLLHHIDECVNHGNEQDTSVMVYNCHS